MKKIYFLFVLAAFIMAPSSITYAQEFVLNGDLELWDDVATPTSWDKAESISQETSEVHGGSYSAGHTSADGTQDFQQNVSGIVAGSNYTISYWYYDNDLNARTRIWSYWLSGGSTIPDNEDELRGQDYSTDDGAWHNYTVSLTAPAGADAFRFEVRVYKQDGNLGGKVFYDDFSVLGAGVSPEPSNYPTDFTATASGVSINLEWTDATGAQLPSGYLVLASTEDNITAPADGTPVADDTDLSDGSGALNIGFGTGMCSFGGLTTNQAYFFKIYPYTNGAADIDYKNDGTAPAASATTADLTIIEAENFDDGWGDWQRVSVVGDQEWIIDPENGVGGSPCAKCSGYAGQPNANEDWMISPAMNFDAYMDEVMNFYNADAYDGPALEVFISNDYDGSDPTTATWTSLTYISSEGFFDWVSSGDIDISGVSGTAVYVAFKFTSTSSESATWEIDDILITGNEVTGVGEQNEFTTEVKIYPNPANNFVHISSDDTQALGVKIFSLVGAEVSSEVIFSGSTKLDIGGFNSGIYLLHFTDEGGNTSIQKLVVK